jgi:hypothetical protein
MKSVADALRLEAFAVAAAKSAAERTTLALELGDADVRTFAHARGISLGDARRLLGRQRQHGRHRSRCHESLFR